MALHGDDERNWVLLPCADGVEGDFLIASEHATHDSALSHVVAYYEGVTGNVYACSAHAGGAVSRGDAPCVRMLGGIEGDSGQVVVLQQDGAYRRMARWDRLAPATAQRTGSLLRTLPQCGCGGSLGVPKLFDSFAELGAYYYCTFVHAGVL